MRECRIDGEYIKADQFLKLEGLAQTGGEAKFLIQEGMVSLNGMPISERGKKFRPGDVISVQGHGEFKICGV